MKRNVLTGHSPPFPLCFSRTSILYVLQPLTWSQRNGLVIPHIFVPHKRLIFSPLDSTSFCFMVILEISSANYEFDWCRMWIQAIAAARAGLFFWNKCLYVVAIYLCHTLEAEHYIVIQASANEGSSVWMSNFAALCTAHLKFAGLNYLEIRDATQSMDRWQPLNNTFDAGDLLASLKGRNDKLWSVNKQLFKGIDSMHLHLVAHSNIKSCNVLLSTYGGRLSNAAPMSVSHWQEFWFGTSICSTRSCASPSFHHGRHLTRPELPEPEFSMHLQGRSYMLLWKCRSSTSTSLVSLTCSSCHESPTYAAQILFDKR